MTAPPTSDTPLPTPLPRGWAILLVALFVATVSAPLLWRTPVGPSQSEGKRPPPRPAAPRDLREAARWPRRYADHWVADYPLRSFLVATHGRAKVFLLGASSSAQVRLGGDGFLYYAPELTAHHRAGEAWATHAEERASVVLETERGLAAGGIRYLWISAPDKATVYPEHVPPAWRPVRPDGNFERIAERLRAAGSRALCDVRPALREARTAASAAGEILYDRTDTHWNELGAYVAAEAIAARLAADGLPLRPLPRPAWAPAPPWSGDLARMLGLDGFLTETPPRHAGIAKLPFSTADSSWKQHVLTEGPADAPTALLHTDSFGVDLAPFLARHFRKLTVVFESSVRRDIVARDAPDVVLQVLVERSLQIPAAPAFTDGPSH